MNDEAVWRDGRGRRVPASVVAEAIERIREREGVCNPWALVAEAEPEDSPLHPLFTWDDEVAARRQRVEEARRLIRSIQVRVVSPESGEEVLAPMFVHVRVLDEQGPTDGYMPLKVVMSDEDMIRRVELDVLRQLEGLRERYASILAFADVWREVDRLLLERV